MSPKRDPDRSALAPFAEELRAQRELAGLSRDELAVKLGYSASLVSMIETGHRTPSRDFAVRCDAAFGCPGTFARLEKRLRNVPFSSGFRPFQPYESDAVNQPDVNISTIEDPIEYQMARINQTQVRPDIGFSFSQGIRTLVRQDPDVIMVGEIRDDETAALAVNAALTGHLVLSTLHTNSAAGAIPRLLDMKVESFLLVSTLDVIIGQR